MNLVQVEGMLSNPVGKPAALSVIKTRRTEPDSINVAREVVQAPAVEAKMLENNIAYIKIPYLGPGKAAEARKQLDPLLKRGATNIVLDLRYTAGGDPKEGVELANAFVESGTIAYLEGQKYPKETLTANAKDALTKVPVAVLVNQATAGAAELVAGAIEDSHRGQVVGVKTFGAGSMQKLIPLDDGSALLISVAKYFTPAGKEIENTEPQEAGIKPTVEVRQTVEEAVDLDDQEIQAPPKEPVKEEDRQLNRAIEILKDPSKITAAKKAA
jgi:carboxyl-terminal processing protease